LIVTANAVPAKEQGLDRTELPLPDCVQADPPCTAISLGNCGHLRWVRALTWMNAHDTVPSALASFTMAPRCSPPDLVRQWCEPSSSPLWRHLPLLRPVTLHQRSNPCVVRLTVQLGHQIVRTQFVEIPPPTTSSVVPDPVTTRRAPSNVASPAHSPPCPRHSGLLQCWVTG
jgi:hypothetical protein